MFALRRPERLTPNQLAAYSGLWMLASCGCVLFVLWFLPAIRRGSHSPIVRLLPIMPLMCCMISVFRMTSRLGKGIKKQIWPTSQFAALRALIDHRAVGVVQVLMTASWAGLWVVGITMTLGGRRNVLQFLGFCPYLVFIWICSLKYALCQGDPPVAGVRLALESGGPIQSEQWGERGPEASHSL